MELSKSDRKAAREIIEKGLQQITFKLFNEWFSYEISDWVTDLPKGSVYD